MANLWRGVGPNVARNAIINAAELASYDQACPLLQAVTSVLEVYALLAERGVDGRHQSDVTYFRRARLSCTLYPAAGEGDAAKVRHRRG